MISRSFVSPVTCLARLWPIAALAAAAVGSSVPAQAGLTEARKSAGTVEIFLGVVPAAVASAHPQGHPERTMHGGKQSSSIHDIHVVAAIFDRATGNRVTDATVTARFLGARGRRWSLPLRSMTINGVVTYGGYTSMGEEMEATISVDVVRPAGVKPREATAIFEYRHD